ncbi:MAG: hypothetical protein ACMXYC_03910 [Candidatus Woesearchaeota archaeon]
MELIIGILGLVCLMIAWVPQTLLTLKHKNHPPLSFTLLYFIGTILLITYSWFIQDIIFLLLNLVIGIGVSITLLSLLLEKK